LKTAYASFFTILIMGFSSAGLGQALVDADWVAAHAGDSDVVLLHVGTASDFASGHLPNARLITVADVSRSSSLPGGDPPSAELMFELSDLDSLRGKLESLGVTNSSIIVIYGGIDQALPSVTRVAFVIDYLGLGENIRLLNGGASAWVDAGYETSTTVEVTAAASGQLRLAPNEQKFASADDVVSLARESGYTLIDARDSSFYDGNDESFGKGGHIPGAVNVPFNRLVDSAGQFDQSRIEQEFRAAGVNPGDKLIVYCHVGMRATQVIFASRLLGHEAALYDGSFQDWVQNNRGDVELP
jgi:thiosulfate/3-mercaptopyruvate sulfurtransferase